jgi:DNA-binding MarR family transcriptional regulator
LQSANKFGDLPEPDPFSPEQFLAWRGFLRVHEAVTRELDRRMRAEHDLPLPEYGILITLVTAPDMRLRMSELGARRLVTPSKISRAIDKLEDGGLVKRTADPGDRRSFFATLTRAGVKRLRAAQVTHHTVVRELLLGRLSEQQVEQLNEIWETALPGVVAAEVWSPAADRV